MALKTFKPIIEISADWVTRAFIGICVYLLVEIRSDIERIKTIHAEQAADIKVSQSNITRLQRDIDRLEMKAQ